ncbi:hypothetical protein FRC15_007295 [Serendipita sp. 397]|nr:hypothetical protein FRC15_007295 [Serendipita sp. 397]
MSNTTIPTIDNETVEAFHAMKTSLRSLFEQLQMIESFEALQPTGPLTSGALPNLSSHERQITDFSHQLASKIQEYVDARAPINRHRLVLPTAQDTNHTLLTSSPVSQTPDIVLSFIFESLAEEGSHEIVPLLLVNKRFHRLVMSNRLLWRNISIEINECLDEVNSLTASYVHACLERSANVSLDINLNCSAMCNQERFLKFYATNVVRNSLTNEDEKYEAYDHFYLLFSKYIVDDTPSNNDELTLYNREDNDELMFYNRKMKEALVIVNSLRGRDRTHTRRWRSAVLDFPDLGRVFREMWFLLDLEMPDLRYLKLEFIPGFDFLPGFKGGLPDVKLPALRDFSYGPLQGLYKMPIKFGSLQVLSFKHCNYMGDKLNMETLSQCLALRDLTLWYECRQKLPGTRKIDIHLPLLTSFTFEGHPPFINYVQFRLPRLEHWNLICPPSKRLQDIEANHIKWQVRPQFRQDQFEAEMAFIVQPLSRTTSLRVEKLKYPDRCLEKLHKMRAEKKLPDRLRRVEIVGAGVLDLTVDS